MRSTYRVIWSKRAASDLQSIVEYLEENWTDKEIRSFFKKFDLAIQAVKSYPEAFPAAKKNKVRRVVLTKQITMYYDVLEEEIRIVSIFDTRQNPEKLNL